MSIDKETIAVYDAHAADYADKFSADAPGASLKRFMDRVSENGTVLDLGCGPGRSAEFMQQAGFTVTCFDASPTMVETARAAGLDAHVRTFDDIDGAAIYDGIWANFSLLHAPRTALPRHFAALANALKPNGVFHIGMKIGTGEKRDHLGRLYTFVTKDELYTLMVDAGIAPDHTSEFTEVGLAKTNDAGIIVQGRKNG